MNATAPQTALAAAMRNEGPYLLEWIAYHRVIGFDDIIITSNDCTDGSDHLLAALAARRIVTHLRQSLPAGGAPQDGAMRLTFAHLAATGAEWLCHIDSDEFLNIRAGEGRLPDLLKAAGEDADVIALPWLMFGTSGHSARTLPILPNFTRCAAGFPEAGTKFKSMFRWQKFGHAEDHRPVDPKADDLRVVSAAGAPLRNNFDGPSKFRKYQPFERAIAEDVAVLNHYATRSEDDFLMKNERGDGQGHTSQKYYLGSKWYQAANQNAAEDRSILRHWPEVDAQLTAWRADPEIAQLEAACLTADSAARADLLTPEMRTLWRVKS